MSYIQIFDILKNGEILKKVRNDACFAKIVSEMTSEQALNNGFVFHIYHPLDYSKTLDGRVVIGVSNAFDAEDRALYLSLINNLLKINIVSEEIEHYHEDIGGYRTEVRTTSQVNRLIVDTAEFKSFVQLRAALTMTRYLIEEPYCSMLKVALTAFKNNEHPDFFVLFQDAHYKCTPVYGDGHSFFPAMAFWNLVSSEDYYEYISTPKILNKFGETDKRLHRMFEDISVNIFGPYDYTTDISTKIKNARKASFKRLVKKLELIEIV